MTRTGLARILTVAMVVLMAIAFSPLTDADTGWRNTVGDVVWTGMFLVFALLVVIGIAAVIARLRNRSGQAA